MSIDSDYVLELDSQAITVAELMELCAVDSEFFATEFFPNTVRLKSAPYHSKVWKYLHSSARMINIQMFRGSGKTTLLRLFIAKGLAYNMFRTAIYVGRSEEKTIQSLDWIKQQIEHNKKFTDLFMLEKGDVWQEAKCEIINKRAGTTITLLGYGVTGSIRGVNVKDHRPNLIVLDDILDEQNTATPEQRQKIDRLVYNALVNSLASPMDDPSAKLVALQTPFNREDYSTLALKDPVWRSIQVGCWSPETKDKPVSERESAWPENWSSQQLRDLRQSYLQRNAASSFASEWECRITSPETASFKPEWLNYYTVPPAREDMVVLGAIDPVPPPTELQISQGLKDKDYECLAVIGILQNRYYLLDYSYERGHEPNWTISEFFRLSLKWRPLCWSIETTAYQKTLHWLLKQAMIERSLFFPVMEMKDRRSKFNRILDCLAGPASNGVFYISPDHTTFIQQFLEYPDVTHDDVLDAVSMCFLKAPNFIPKSSTALANEQLPTPANLNTPVQSVFSANRSNYSSGPFPYGRGAP